VKEGSDLSASDTNQQDPRERTSRFGDETTTTQKLERAAGGMLIRGGEDAMAGGGKQGRWRAEGGVLDLLAVLRCYGGPQYS
jgi:hypothetical protein